MHYFGDLCIDYSSIVNKENMCSSNKTGGMPAKRIDTAFQTSRYLKNVSLQY